MYEESEISSYLQANKQTATIHRCSPKTQAWIRGKGLCSSQCSGTINFLSAPIPLALLCWFPRAAPTNHHQLCGLKQQISSLIVLEPQVQNQGVSRVESCLEALRNNLLHACILASGVHWLLLGLEWRHTNFCLCLHLAFFLCISSMALFIWTPVIGIRAHPNSV